MMTVIFIKSLWWIIPTFGLLGVSAIAEVRWKK